MQGNYLCYLNNPNFHNISHVVSTANINDKHDRSAPSHYHWKILKCRMIIFSCSSLLACPDKNEIQRVHVIINNSSEDYDKLVSLFLKFSLVQEGDIKKVTPEIYLSCFRYTMTARIAPSWNTLGYDYLINNRDFLSTNGAQDGIKYNILISDFHTILEIKPVKITLIKSNENYATGNCIRVLPSLNKATIEDYHDTLPKTGTFKYYKDLRRHWKNIHGYRLPEEESTYYTVRFWRGEPLTYPTICLTSHYPIVVPMSKSAENNVLTRFLGCLKNRMAQFLGMTLEIKNSEEKGNSHSSYEEMHKDTQAVSLCTPSQQQHF